MSVVGKKARTAQETLAAQADAIQHRYGQGGFTANGHITASFESLSELDHENLTGSMESAVKGLEASMESLGGFGDLTTAQKDAMAVLAVATGDLVGYHRQALGQSDTGAPKGAGSVVSVESLGDFDFMDKAVPSMEAFDNSNLTDFIGLSMVYNQKVAKQGEFAEAFYRTVILTPEQGGADVTIRSHLVLNHFLHNTRGDHADFKQRRLLEAAINYKILADQSTTLVPEVHSGNADLFVPESKVERRNVELGNRTVTTAPLLLGKRVNLVGLAQNTLVKIAGQANQTDALDRAVGLKSLYLQLGDADVLSFDVETMPRAAFIKGNQGLARELELNFRTSSLQLNAHSVNYKGEALVAPVLKQIVDGGYTVTLSMTVTGQVDTEKGNASVNAAPINVEKVVNAAGEILSTTAAGVGKDIADGLAELAIIGWEPNARLSNANRRLRGLQLNSSEYTERYPVMLGSPLSIPSPLAEARGMADIDLLVTAARLRNDNMAITTLLRFTDGLSRWRFLTDVVNSDDLLPEVEGIARFLVKPWYRERDLDLRTLVVSLRSYERVQDVQAALANVLRSDIQDAILESNYKTALDAYTGYTGEKVNVLIGSDPKTASYILQTGDSRTLGDDITFEKVSSVDQRIRKQIFWTFKRPTEGLDPLNCGTHFWIPELISHVNVSRDETQIREAMVQPRNRHVNHLPIFGKINVIGLDEVLSEGWAIPVATFPGDADDTTGQDPVGGAGTGSDTGAGTQP
ncbi:putative major capsid protein [Pseudomonas phage pPa_SNUABM_DT01]|nr:putative major capsid protein [Pseudomonas phage pPa_SNUABM_DT01]